MFERLSKEELDKLHAASLEVMERSGVRVLDEAALTLLKKGGCEVDANLVRFPSNLVEWALSTAPKSITLYDQTQNPCIELDGRCAYYGNGSDLLYIVDHRTRKRREPVLQDVRDMVALLDALPHIDFVMSGFIPQDVPVAEAQRHQMLAMLEHTNKPIVYVTTDLTNTQSCIAMAEIVAGGADALREHPFAANYINIANPLRHNPESIQKLMWLSEKGLPFVYRPSIVTRGISTPVTWAGFLVVNNVAGLVGVVLSQLVICHEIIGWVKQYMKNVQVSDETLALDVVDEVIASDGDFLQTEHTVLNYRIDHYPELLDRQNYDAWEAEGGLTLRERAATKVDAILGSHAPLPFEDTVRASLEAVIDR